MVEIKIIDAMENFDEAVPLIRANWKESGSPIELIPSDVRAFYKYMSDMNCLYAAGVYKEGILAGYCIATFAPHPLNYSVRVCSISGIYLIPELRKGSVTTRLMDAIRTVAKQQGAHSIDWHAAAGSDFLKTLEARFIPINSYFREEL